MPHQFKHYDNHELDGLSTFELAHLALVDQCLSATDMNPVELERMSDDALRAILAQHRTIAPPAPAPRAPSRPLVAMQPRTGRRYRASVWDSERCTMVHIGVFDTPEARDAAVRDAKTRRALGLPLKG
jgi:hypothetical protein